MPPQPVAHSSISHPLLQLLEEVQDVDEGRDVSLRGSQKPEHKEPLVVLRDVEDAKPVSDLRSLIRPNPQSISGWPSRSEGTEGRGLEPRSARARRFSRPLPYQLGLALLNSQSKGDNEDSTRRARVRRRPLNAV